MPLNHEAVSVFISRAQPRFFLSFPVIVGKETTERIECDDCRTLSEEGRERCSAHPKFKLIDELLEGHSCLLSEKYCNFAVGNGSGRFAAPDEKGTR